MPNIVKHREMDYAKVCAAAMRPFAKLPWILVEIVVVYDDDDDDDDDVHRSYVDVNVNTSNIIQLQVIGENE